jgi:hypothetical protein
MRIGIEEPRKAKNRFLRSGLVCGPTVGQFLRQALHHTARLRWGVLRRYEWGVFSAAWNIGYQPTKPQLRATEGQYPQRRRLDL